MRVNYQRSLQNGRLDFANDLEIVQRIKDKSCTASSCEILFPKHKHKKPKAYLQYYEVEINLSFVNVIRKKNYF